MILPFTESLWSKKALCDEPQISAQIPGILPGFSYFYNNKKEKQP